MKIGFMMLPLLCAASVAMADGMDNAGAEGKVDATAASTRPPAHDRMVNRAPKRLPSDDIRHCLDLKSNAEIIRCSEMRRKK